MIKQRENQAIKRHDFVDLLIELKNKDTIENMNKSDQDLGEEKAANGIGRILIVLY